MAIQIEFSFDFVSPYSYLAATQLPGLIQTTGAEIVYRPFRVLDLMKIVGNRPTTMECQNKGNYSGVDLARWAARYKVTFQRNPHRRAAHGSASVCQPRCHRRSPGRNCRIMAPVSADTIDMKGPWI